MLFRLKAIFFSFLFAIPLLVFVSKPVWHSCSESKLLQENEQKNTSNTGVDQSEFDCSICDIELSFFQSDFSFAVISELNTAFSTKIDANHQNNPFSVCISILNKGSPSEFS